MTVIVLVILPKVNDNFRCNITVRSVGADLCVGLGYGNNIGPWRVKNIVPISGTDNDPGYGNNVGPGAYFH
jgi:hypothetical protein